MYVWTNIKINNDQKENRNHIEMDFEYLGPVGFFHLFETFSLYRRRRLFICRFFNVVVTFRN